MEADSEQSLGQWLPASIPIRRLGQNKEAPCPSTAVSQPCWLCPILVLGQLVRHKAPEVEKAAEKSKKVS